MSVSAFFKTEITSTSSLENAGNFCFSPLRTLFGGRSFSIVSEGEKVVEWTPPKKSTLDKIILIAVSILLLIPATIAGVFIKGIAFISSEVRAKQALVINYMATAAPKKGNETPRNEDIESDQEDPLFDEDEKSLEEVDYTRRGEISQEVKQHFGRIEVILKRGDITKEHCDAIVNAAKKPLVKGRGVDHAIHKAAGPAVQAECLALPAVKDVRCPEGEVRVTGAGNLPAKRIFHTVGPRWNGGTSRESTLLKNCYINCLKTANEMGYGSIAFPSISTGIFGYPVEKAAKVAFKAISDTANEFGPGAPLEARFILFSPEDMEAYTKALENCVER